MKNALLFSFFCFLFMQCGTNKTGVHKSKSTQVYFIPTLHNVHQVNINYNYDSLRAYIRRINPSIIAVEIRPEDIYADSSYLKKNYPLEMHQMRYWFPGSEVVGFDWLGKELEGKPIPEDYWKNKSNVKQLQRELAKDSTFQEKIKPCYQRNNEREELLKTLSLQNLIKSKDAEIVNQQYKCFEEKVAGSKYYELANFYKERNEHIFSNIRSILSSNTGKKILIVTGDDHYVALKDKFEHK